MGALWSRQEPSVNEKMTIQKSFVCWILLVSILILRDRLLFTDRGKNAFKSAHFRKAVLLFESEIDLQKRTFWHINPKINTIISSQIR